jgi:hypothetical protein
LPLVRSPFLSFLLSSSWESHSSIKM